jgi:hypothetical protein
MYTQFRSTVAAATGAVFAVVLTVANGEGGTLSAPQDIAATAALTLLIPFSAYVGGLLHARSVSDTDTWLATTATAAGAVGAGMKLLSDAPQQALNHEGIAAGGQSALALTAVADAITILALFPLGLFALATGVSALRSGALPGWLGIGALVTGVSLVVNGCFLHTENLPALLVLSLWTLLASIHLVRASRRHEPSSASARAASSA